MSSKDLGAEGEEIAIKLLENQGYKILQKNFRCKIGEIDIVALEGKTLVFVEVKTRWTKEFGLPEEAITPWKIRKIARAGDYFQLLNPGLPKLLRIDAVCLDLSDGLPGTARIIKNLTG